MPHSVLLVDDDAQVRRLVARMLHLEGYDVTERPTAAAALAALGQGPFDLVLTDIMMPDMNGCELGRAVARRWPGQRVLYYSGHVFSSLFESGICPRDIPFIQKPFGAGELRRRIDETLAAPPYRFD
jgi:two-component system cell cycle response regulator CpdR